MAHILIWRTFHDAVTLFQSHIMMFFKSMAFPLILFIACSFLQTFSQHQAPADSRLVYMGLGNLLQPFLVIWMANICYRIAATGMPGKKWWSIAETWTVVALILLSLLTALGAGIPAAIVYLILTALDASLIVTGVITGLLYGILLLYMMARFSLMFPSIAVSEKMDVEGAWNMSKENGWRIIGLMMLPAVIVGVGVLLVVSVLSLIFPPPASFMISFIVAQLGSILIFCIDGIALGLVYKQLK